MQGRTIRYGDIGGGAMSLSLAQADTLLAQWAVWAFDDAQTGYSVNRWHRDWRPNFDPEYADVLGEIIRCHGYGGDEQMVMVDRAVSQLGHRDSHHSHILRARYRLGHKFKREPLDRALRLFAAIYDELTSASRLIML